MGGCRRDHDSRVANSESNTVLDRSACDHGCEPPLADGRRNCSMKFSRPYETRVIAEKVIEEATAESMESSEDLTSSALSAR